MKTKTDDTALLIESCGLHVEAPVPSPDAAINTAKMYGCNLDGHVSKGWERCEFEDADLILAMEFWQYKRLVELLPHKKEHVQLLREFTPFPENVLCNIDDPFGQSADAYERCFSSIDRAVRAIMMRL